MSTEFNTNYSNNSTPQLYTGHDLQMPQPTYVPFSAPLPALQSPNSSPLILPAFPCCPQPISMPLAGPSLPMPNCYNSLDAAQMIPLPPMNPTFNSMPRQPSLPSSDQNLNDLAMDPLAPSDSLQSFTMLPIQPMLVVQSLPTQLSTGPRTSLTITPWTGSILPHASTFPQCQTATEAASAQNLGVYGRRNSAPPSFRRSRSKSNSRGRSRGKSLSIRSIKCRSRDSSPRSRSPSRSRNGSEIESLFSEDHQDVSYEPSKRELVDSAFEQLEQMFGENFDQEGNRGQNILRLKVKTRTALEQIIPLIEFCQTENLIVSVSCPISTKKGRSQIRGFLAYLQARNEHDADRLEDLLQIFNEVNGCPFNTWHRNPPSTWNTGNTAA